MRNILKPLKNAGFLKIGKATLGLNLKEVAKACTVHKIRTEKCTDFKHF